jgi:hypothetical protein
MTPVIAFGSSQWEDAPHVKECITVKFDTLHQALQYIGHMYGQ